MCAIAAALQIWDDEDVVEVPCEISRAGVKPISTGPLAGSGAGIGAGSESL